MMTPVALARLAAAASVAALAVALLSQHVGGLPPCPLCQIQRLPYVVNIILGAVAMVVTLRGRAGPAMIALIGAIFALGAAIAFYHVGVEQGWFAGLATCAGGGETPATVDALKEMLLNKPPPPPCDVVQWSLFGVSMAGYNLLYASALAAISLFGAAINFRKVRS